MQTRERGPPSVLAELRMYIVHTRGRTEPATRYLPAMLLPLPVLVMQLLVSSLVWTEIKTNVAGNNFGLLVASLFTLSDNYLKGKE